jgi:hypothetical protein
MGSATSELPLSRFGTVLADLDQVAPAFEILFKENRLRLFVMLISSKSRSGRCSRYVPAGLEQLARTTYKEAQGLAEWKGLRWRRRIGPSACRALRRFLLATIASRFFRKVKRYRLHRMGLL